MPYLLSSAGDDMGASEQKRDTLEVCLLTNTPLLLTCFGPELPAILKSASYVVSHQTSSVIGERN